MVTSWVTARFSIHLSYTIFDIYTKFAISLPSFLKSGLLAARVL